MKRFKNIVVTEVLRPNFISFEKGRVFEMKNRKSFGISFCQSGRITYRMNGKCFISDPLHAVILPEGKNYSIYGDEGGIFPMVNFHCEGLKLDEIVVLSLSKAETCIKICEKIQSCFLREGKRYLVFSYMYDLLEQVFSKNVDENPLHPLMSYLEENLSDASISNTLMAELLGISEVYLRKLFIKFYHVTPRQYLLELRLRRAKQLLSDGCIPVSEVAETCGFSSVYHFCRAFRLKVGMTPSNFARINRIQGI